MTITFVKKILLNGDSCPKCQDVEHRLRNSGYYDRIDRVEVVDERDENTQGAVLARIHGVDLAPFFVVEDERGTRVYTVFLKFVKEELNESVESSAKDAEDTLRANPDLDFL